MCREVVDGLTDGEVSDCVIYRLYVGKQYTHKKKRIRKVQQTNLS